jgi:predicted dithiol-disulfide oxidoreductase (DUF899 family)
METPPIVSPEEWEAARQDLLVGGRARGLPADPPDGWWNHHDAYTEGR